MADVQLERGHVRIANRLWEAITYAPFTLTQLDLVLVIIRLTYGWGTYTVYQSHKDLAEKCGMAFTGGFRRALDELIREGVVIEVVRSEGRKPAAYALNKDFETWGKFSVANQLLERLYSERPRSIAPHDSELDIPKPAVLATNYIYYARDDKRLKIGFSNDPWKRVAGMRTVRPELILAAVEAGPRSQEYKRHEQFEPYRLTREWFKFAGALRDHVLKLRDACMPQERHDDWPEEQAAEDSPPMEVGLVPHGGTIDGPKSQPANELAAPKDNIERHTITPTTAGAKLDLIQLVVAANTGLGEHVDPKRRQPIPRILPGQGATVEACEKLEAAGVPQAFAESAIYETARTHRADGVIASLLYFVPKTLRLWEEKQQADAMASAPRPAGLPKPDRRPSIEQRNSTAQQEQRDEVARARLERAYQQERKTALDAWAKSNPDEYKAMYDAAVTDSGLEPEMLKWAKSAIDVAIATEWARRTDFVSFDAWLETRAVAS